MCFLMVLEYRAQRHHIWGKIKIKRKIKKGINSIVIFIYTTPSCLLYQEMILVSDRWEFPNVCAGVKSVYPHWLFLPRMMCSSWSLRSLYISHGMTRCLCCCWTLGDWRNFAPRYRELNENAGQIWDWELERCHGNASIWKISSRHWISSKFHEVRYRHRRHFGNTRHHHLHLHLHHPCPQREIPDWTRPSPWRPRLFRLLHEAWTLFRESALSN